MEDLVFIKGTCFLLICIEGLGYVLIYIPNDTTMWLVSQYVDIISFAPTAQGQACFSNPAGTIVDSCLPYVDPVDNTLKMHPITMLCLPPSAESMISEGFLPSLTKAERIELIDIIKINFPGGNTVYDKVGFWLYKKISKISKMFS
jgi:hypothetical protein